MALNIPVFRTRALTALIFVIVMLTGLLWNFWSFFILFSAIHFGCWLEYQKLSGLIDKGYSEITFVHKYGVIIAGWCLMFYLTGVRGSQISTNSIYLFMHRIGSWAGLIILLAIPVLEIIFWRKVNFKYLMVSILGLMYISLTWALLANLRSRFDNELLGKFYVILIVASIWINDTMAYLVGSFIGKTPITKISPKKTWEGTIGGIVLSIIIIGIFGFFFNSDYDWASTFQLMVIAGVASVSGTFGDLLESKLKRMADVKDSGHIMPGHGGFLDRFDSLLLAIPFVWFCIILFMK
jgi:phosphatidate cytidylyltransferase